MRACSSGLLVVVLCRRFSWNQSLAVTAVCLLGHSAIQLSPSCTRMFGPGGSAGSTMQGPNGISSSPQTRWLCLPQLRSACKQARSIGAFFCTYALSCWCFWWPWCRFYCCCCGLCAFLLGRFVCFVGILSWQCHACVLVCLAHKYSDCSCSF